MDIDLSVLRSLESEKDISLDHVVKAIEDALLIAYHRSDGAASSARVELDRKSGHVTVWATETGRDEDRRAGVRRHPGRLRPDRGDHRQAGDPAAAARRRGRADLRRVRRARGRHRRRRHPAGQGPAQRPRRPGQARGGAAARRAGAGRALRARRADPLLRGPRPQGPPRALGHAVPHPPKPGEEAVRAGGARDRRRHRRDRRDRPRGGAPHQDRGPLAPAGRQRQGRLHRPDGQPGPERHERAARREDRHRGLVRRTGRLRGQRAVAAG